ncbi:hypothetical protein MBA17_07505 [Streptosporangium sp. KLBMP 9127]|nr:hypothetical protein [Streptosporangium sp. KLBMP 9127]
MLRGFEPYTALVAKARQAVADPAAVVEFPYDWRLSIEYNAHLLADAAQRHLDAWRAHPRGSRQARLVLVAHSMGGLIASYFTHLLGGAGEVRAVVTLGTPFHGSVKAAMLLDSGRATPLPLPRARLRALAGGMPGLHDLLPTYRCVDEGESARRLTAADVAGLGGDAELAGQALERRARLLGAGGQAGWPELWPLVGVRQPTLQSVTLTGEGLRAARYSLRPSESGGVVRSDAGGDGTVYQDAACPAGLRPLFLPQSHGALAARAESIIHACTVIASRERGPWLAGDVQLGLEVPDVVTAGQEWEMIVRGTADPALVSVRVEELTAGRGLLPPTLRSRTDHLAGRLRLPRPGLFRIGVKTGGLSAITELVLATAEDPPSEGHIAHAGRAEEN